nr:hypothetical protein [Tanacetum cinerariifolium]
PEWSRHVTIVHQTKDLHTADYTQLYDFLKYNQKEVDELKAERLAKIPLALMANSNNPYAFSATHQDQSSFNQNYLQQPMPNPKDVTDSTTAMNMALALMAKAFKLNYSTPTNNNQIISSNPRNRQIAQPGMNMGQDRQMQMVRGNGGNQFRQYAEQNIGNLNGYNAVLNVRNQVGMQYLDELKYLSNLEYHDEIKIAELTKNFNGMSIEIQKKEKLLQQEQWAYLSTHPSKRLNSFCYDDDDDEDYTSAIIPDEPVLSTEEPDNSLSMGDEHLDTILATKSDEFIKSSVENLIPIPSESEGIPEHMCGVPSHNNSPPLNFSKDTIEDLSESNEEFSSIDDDSFSIDDIDYVEASPSDSELVSSEVMEIVIPETKYSSTSLNSLLEETNTFDNSLPEFETFCFDVEEISSGSTTTHPDLSLLEYEAFYDDHVKEISSGSTTTHSDSPFYALFIFDLSINQFPPADRSDSYEFTDELIPFLSPSEYVCFLFKDEPNSRDFTKDVVEDISPSKELQDSDSHMEEIDLFLNPDDPMPPGIEEDDGDSERDIPNLEELLDNYSISLPTNESYHFNILSPYRPPVKPPDGNTGTLNINMMGDVSDQKVPIPNLTITCILNQEKSPDLLSHLGFEAFQPSAECPMIINGKNIPLSDVPLFHFYPLDQLNDSYMEEIDLSFNPDDPMPPSIEEDDDDSERDILILEELIDNYSLSLTENESFHSDIPSFSRPTAKPPD